MRTYSVKSGNAILLLLAVLLFSSCASLSPNGVGRVKRYAFADMAVPDAFNGYKIAFVSDIHYPSLFILFIRYPASAMFLMDGQPES